jgi:hypothetical protein
VSLAVMSLRLPSRAQMQVSASIYHRPVFSKTLTTTNQEIQ